MDTITQQDCARFGTMPGRCEDQALWEALAVLVGVRLFGRLAAARQAGDLPQRSIVVHTDSAAAEGALRKLRSRDDRVNVVVREMALWLAAHQVRLDYRHVPGVENELADALSRGARPAGLGAVRLLNPGLRQEDYWVADSSPPPRRQARVRKPP